MEVTTAKGGGNSGEEIEDIEGKVALITGASSGLGRVFSVTLAERGCNVIIAARRTRLLESLCDEINALTDGDSKTGETGECSRRPRPGRVAIVEVDVSKDESVIDAAVEKAWTTFGVIDILVNNAGLRGTVKGPLDTEEAEWNSVMHTNLRGAWLMSKAVGKRMRAAKRGGSFINISSIAGLDRSLLPGAVAYGTSKAGLNYLTKYLALELGPLNIRVNAIAAGLYETEITVDLFGKGWLNGVAEKIVPLKRWGRTHPDLTSVVLFLSSDASKYITGNLFIVDGGQSIPGIPIWSSL